MENFVYYFSIWLATAVPVFAGTWWLSRQLSIMESTIDKIEDNIKNMKHVTACGKPVKAKKVIRANDK